MKLFGKMLSFNKIGITLEPDDRGSAPRAPKIMGS
jgi:hypothetical protein